MSAVQLSFTLRTSDNVSNVKLLGSWDNYNGQLPLSADPSVGGGWKGTFRFPTTTLQLGQRYWYYYIIDGYHVSHDPSKPSTKEPTTGRELNILDVPSAGGKAAAEPTSKSSKRLSVQVPKGRPVSQSEIKSPKPTKPYETRKLTHADYVPPPTVDELAQRFSTTTIGSYSSSPDSYSSGSSGRSSPSTASDSDSYSTPGTPQCSCNRWGITRKGDKVKLDCGGSRCGYSDDSSDCYSEESDGERSAVRSSRRHTVHVRR